MIDQPPSRWYPSSYHRPHLGALFRKRCTLLWFASFAGCCSFMAASINTSKGVNHFIVFDRSAVNARCKSAHSPYVSRPLRLQLLVSFVHFETDEMTTCEVTNKRNNLATFLLAAVSNSSPLHVHFVFTFPGRKPRPSDVMETAGIPPESESGKTIASVLSNQANNVELLRSHVNHPAADLCHHHAVIFDRKRDGRQFNFVLLLNDGVRGPFFNADNAMETVWHLFLDVIKNIR